MEKMDDQVATASVSVGAGAKSEWMTPQLARLDAADAEAGANPINDEGAFAFGS